MKKKTSKKVFFPKEQIVNIHDWELEDGAFIPYRAIVIKNLCSDPYIYLLMNFTNSDEEIAYLSKQILYN